jgi:hypothetical protein
MRVIEKTEDEEIIEIRPKYKKKIIPVSKSNEQGEEQEQASGEITTEIPKELENISNSGNTSKPVNRIYYISKTLNENNIYFVIQKFDVKSKELVGKFKHNLIFRRL